MAVEEVVGSIPFTSSFKLLIFGKLPKSLGAIKGL